MSEEQARESLVYLEGVSKIYPSAQGEVYAARNVTLEVRSGEFFSLLGSSGSGKTTTLRLIGGFEIPDYGRVFIGGEEVTYQPPYRRNVHTVFQNYALFPHLSVAQNIAYPLTLARTSRADIDRRITESLALFRLQGLGDRKPAQLSGGQQQRVALARALINRPKVLLLDEPLSALDAKVREEVRQELRELQRQTNLTFIYVTHDQEEALALSDRIAVMHQGQVEQIGTSQEIYDCPASLFVAQFIGKANLLSGTVLEANHEFTKVEANGLCLLAAPCGHALNPGQNITLMVRPERLQINSAVETENQISGVLENITYVGQLVEYQVKTQVGPLKITQLSQRETYPQGESLDLRWNASDCIIIPPES
ncbi:ABC transporter ATP-binding protein [Leptolyngbya sp. FACHB-261]|uniref:ABC transporter ATP-binding protein n=1 Tax=Leptolyngbya sp. FACHB-261 TaxID=2692806 RepID=UPI0016842770|nr:ABC transporter ATP-binding protein [Leptolyngbya sp. FACHB-261]MBD2102219.1 ABC transporter ATP-binding protein [Leptolyngbya sp. FACHB-261]